MTCPTCESNDPRFFVCAGCIGGDTDWHSHDCPDPFHDTARAESLTPLDMTAADPQEAK